MSETKSWTDPVPEMITNPVFEAIWQVIKTWDIAVPDAYSGYCGATGTHVIAIMDALPAPVSNSVEKAARAHIDDIVSYVASKQDEAESLETLAIETALSAQKLRLRANDLACALRDILDYNATFPNLPGELAVAARAAIAAMEG